MDPRTLRMDLERLVSRLRRLWAGHGVLRVVVFVATALLLVYALDRNLSLPPVVRGVLGLGVLAVTGHLFWRGVVRPLSRDVQARDIAGVVEERFPEFDGRLVSTLQLEGDALRPDRNISEAMVNRLRTETLAVREAVRLDAIFELRGLRRLALAAAVLVAVDLGFAVTHPGLIGIFANRMMLGSARWPRATTLSVEFPEAADYFQVEYEDERPVRVKIARGASLPVTVRATGTRPEFIELTTTSGEGRAPAAGLLPTGPSEWVGRFRGVREGFSFRPSGGDDDGVGREVAVEVFLAPEVASVETEVRFPAYTRLEPVTEARGDVEAPVGSEVRVRVRVQSSVADGAILFDGGTTSAPLVPIDGDPTHLSGSFMVDASHTWSLSLLGTNGFKNLEPATYAVVAVPDRAPSLRLLEPQRADTDVTPNGLIALRLAADDDFGISSIDLTMQALGQEKGRAFDLMSQAAPDQDPRRRLIYTLIELRETPFPHAEMTRPAQAGDSYGYSIAVSDNHEDADGTKTPNRTAISERRVDVVSVNEKLRLLTERQIRMKDEVRGIRDFQDEKLQRLRQILGEFEQTEGDAAPARDELMSLEISQGQMTTRSTRLARSFSAMFEEYLLNRLDSSAAADRVVPMLVARKQASIIVDDFDFAVYRPIVDAYRAGTFGDLDVVGRQLVMLSHALDISETLSPDAAAAISLARLVRDAEAQPGAVRDAVGLQEQIVKRLDELLIKMDEWEDFQEILTLFRDLLEDQRNLHERTRSQLGGK